MTRKELTTLFKAHLTTKLYFEYLTTQEKFLWCVDFIDSIDGLPPRTLTDHPDAVDFRVDVLEQLMEAH